MLYYDDHDYDEDDYATRQEMLRLLRRYKRIRNVLVCCFVLISVLLLLTFFWGCSLDDDRDLCCEEVILDYRYVRQETDEYKAFVQVMRHFLFDERGKFLREIPFNHAAPQQIRLLKLPIGTYTVVTIGNATTSHTRLTEPVIGVTDLNDFRLAVANVQNDGSFANGDQLFWSTRTFVSEENKRHRYLCDLSNIHCHLFVRVFWHVLPTRDGTYTLQLDGVPLGYRLHPAQAQSMIIRDADPQSGMHPTPNRVIHTFPPMGSNFGRYRTKVPLYNLELQSEFITLRYTNTKIPIFQLFWEGEAISPIIDLARAFASWGWRPDEHPEQIYRIEMEILEDGRVVVNQWADASVLDWQDGGLVNVER